MDLNGCQSNCLWSRIVSSINQLHSGGIIPSCSIHYKVGHGSLICFWIDTWVGDFTLRDRFNRIYHLENDKECLVCDRISNGAWAWDWLRPISSGRYLSEFSCMLEEIASVEVDQDSATPVSGHFLIRPSFRLVVFGTTLMTYCSLPCIRALGGVIFYLER